MKSETSSNLFGHPVRHTPGTLESEDDSPLTDTSELHLELAAQKESYLRLAADFTNYKKRTQRDSQLLAAAEKEAFIHDLLPSLDNLERALANKESTSYEQLHQGVGMTLQQLGMLLKKDGIEVDEAIGLPFDPHRHEALSMRNDPSQPDHVVLDVIQRGYRRGDKVFRPAKVIVNDFDY